MGRESPLALRRLTRRRLLWRSRSERIEQIANSLGVPPKDVMDNILVARIFHPEHQVAIVERIAGKIVQDGEPYSMVVRASPATPARSLPPPLPPPPARARACCAPLALRRPDPNEPGAGNSVRQTPPIARAHADRGLRDGALPL